MPDFGLNDLIDPLRNAGKELGDDELPDKKPVLNLSGSYEIPFQVSEVGFAVEPHAGAKLYVLNNPAKDSDQMGVLGQGKVAGNEARLDHQIEFKDHGAWTKYELEAGVTATAGGDLSVLNLEGSISRRMLLYDYHYHQNRSTKVSDAILGDLRDFRFAVDPKSLEKLEDQEAIAYRVPGRLSLRVEASWSDLFTANLGGLFSLLQVSGLLRLGVDAGATLKFDIGLADDFILILTRPSPGRIRLAGKKAKTNKLGIGGSIGAVASLVDSEDNQDALNRLVAQVMAALADTALEQIERLLQQTDFDNLSQEESNLLARLIQRLGLGDEAGRAERFAQLWRALVKRVEDLVKGVVENRISLAFEFEYLRIKSEESVLDVTLPAEVVIDHYDSLLKRQLQEILAWMRQNPHRIELNKFLHQRQLTQSTTWGLSLGLGRWNYGGDDKRELEEIVQETYDGRQRVTFRRARGYEAQDFGKSISYMVDISAQMGNFSDHFDRDDFRYSLKMEWIWNENALSEEELADYLDQATIWGILGVDHANRVRGDLASDLGKRAEVRLHLADDEDLCETLLPLLAPYNIDRAARSMAKATPRWSMIEARNLIPQREDVYAPLWKFYLMQSESDPASRQPREWAAYAADRLEDRGVEGSHNEGKWPNPLQRSFSRLIQLNGDEGSGNYSGIYRRWRQFSDALGKLPQAKERRDIRDAVKDMDPLWDHPLHVRAFGAYVVSTAEQNGLLPRLERTLTVKFEDKEQDWIFGTKRRA